MGYTAKSVILDIADNHGDGSFLGIRSIEYKLAGVLVAVNSGNASFYQTSFRTDHEAEYAFTTSLSKVGVDVAGLSWLTWTSAPGGGVTNQRIICVFDSPIEFDEVVVNNSHSSGGSTSRGAKSVKITISSDAITSTVYNEAIANSEVIYHNYFLEHVASNIVDDQTLNIFPEITFESTGALDLDPGISVSLTALLSAGILDLDSYPGLITTLSPFESVGALDLDHGVSVDVQVLASTGSLDLDPVIGIEISPLESVGSLTLGSFELIAVPLHPSTLFFFILTGQPDALDDVQIPIKSFQARHRTGKPTYLSVTIPGTDYSQQISDRPNGEMVVRMAKVDQGEVYHAEEILRVALEEIRPDNGARNKSITLTGHATAAYGSKIVELQGAVFQTGSAGKERWRLATPDIFLRPGDTAAYGVDSILVDNITYSVGEGQQLMEVAA